MGSKTEESDFDSQPGHKIFRIFKAFRVPLESTQPRIRYELELFSQGYNGQSVMLFIHLYPLLRLRTPIAFSPLRACPHSQVLTKYKENVAHLYL